MAVEKGNFLMPVCKSRTFETLTDEEAGRIIKAIYKFAANNERDAAAITKMLNDRFLLSTYQEIEDFVAENETKYKQKCEQNRENGRMGGRPPKEEE